MLGEVSLLSLFFELLASFWCPCTILPHFVIESGPKAFMETEKFQLFTRFEFPSYVSIKSKLRCPPADKPLGIWAFEHRFMQIPSSSSRQNCSNAPPTQLFVKGKFDNRDFLLLDQISAGKTWHFRFKLPTPARQRFKFPSPWARTTVKCQWVAREMLRWEIVFNCF